MILFQQLQEILKIQGYSAKYNAPFFNEFVIDCPLPAAKVIKALAKKGILAGYDLGQTSKEFKNSLLICATETKTPQDIEMFVSALKGVK